MAKPVMLNRLRKGEVFVVTSELAFATIKVVWIGDGYRVKLRVTWLGQENSREFEREYPQSRLGVAVLYLNRMVPLDGNRLQGWISAASEARLRLVAVKGSQNATSRSEVPSGAFNDDFCYGE